MRTSFYLKSVLSVFFYEFLMVFNGGNFIIKFFCFLFFQYITFVFNFCRLCKEVVVVDVSIVLMMKTVLFQVIFYLILIIYFTALIDTGKD